MVDQNGDLTSNSVEMAEILSKQYTEVFSKPMQSGQPSRNSAFDANSILSTVLLTAADFELAIDELSPSAAAGPDGFPALLLKKCKTYLVHALVYLWTKSLEEEVVPSKLKNSLITPIHKGGSKSLAANYRPIALTSHLIKFFEKVIRKHIIKHIHE